MVRIRLLAVVGVTMLAGAEPLGAQSALPPAFPVLPFTIGETLVYHANLGRLKGSGRAEMRVAGGEEVRGRATYLLQFDLGGRVAGFLVEDHTRSWLDPITVTALRFTKRERSPLSSVTQAVEMYPERGEWTAADDSGALATSAPLDELSFIYFVRTLSLADGASYLFARHFDATRNPTRVRVIGRELVTVPAGEFRTVVIEMRVRDPRRYDGEGIVRINLTDDARRIPVRIASHMRRAGSTVLSLESMTPRAFATQ